MSNIDYLLTECDVCTGKYLAEVFVQTQRRRSELSAEKKTSVSNLPYEPKKQG